MKFPCTKCGLCCSHVDRSNQTKWLNRGDGACRYLNMDTNLCEIYENRPEICRIDSAYKYFSQKISLANYHKANAEVCNTLQSEHGLPLSKRIIILEKDYSLN
ncbi:protein of unknown function UPF0153 [Polaromonas naphthalenivorans CJ2]|uniref:YkgJ family cysteine cluster protein n=2 Tax=Polaromonas naphthalenivorans TaxID=216465 RepID=A1VQX1_POLNA|nr:protein of unknown function UPF0153 [Polaromonas naphthalenivorans CJ2]